MGFNPLIHFIRIVEELLPELQYADNRPDWRVGRSDWSFKLFDLFSNRTQNGKLL
jgi:hypothetical protein